ncbi:MAG: hypothetical protein CVV21_07950 [Candidatus Goldiibacteriota bacterium HGW-Goldbacteria-1]|jgi:hypothetical protein|nr:MAG: hypothetical protein CVV21_07950 [Candidatus Goldiibacteriota bacterium HGW-Goldbacteria-1]
MNIKDSTKKENTHLLPLAVSAAIITAFSIIYGFYNIPATIAAAAVIIVIYIKYRDKPVFETGEKDYSRMYKFFIFAIAAALALRFISITSMPYDFYTDELNELTEAYFRLTGQKELFGYSTRFGSSLLYFSLGVIMAVMAVVKENIDLLRFIPAVVSVLTAAALYFFGDSLKNKKLGIVLAFLFLTSGWALFLSRKLMENIYVPLFAVLIFTFLNYYIRNKKERFLYLTGAVYFAGLFTYSSWVLITAFIAYFLFEYRKEIGLKKILVLSSIIAVSLGLYMLLFMQTKGPSWAMGMTVFKGSDGVFQAVLNLKNLFVYLLQPMQYNHLSHTQPAVSATEFLFLAAGIILALINIKKKIFRIILAGLVISSATLFISKDAAHHLRHVMLLPFIIITAGFFLNHILNRKYALYAVAAHTVLFIFILLYHFNYWPAQMNISHRDKQAADYINKKYANNDYILIHEGVVYGNFPMYLRTKAAHNPAKEPKTVILLTNYFMRQNVKTVFPETAVKYFYDFQGNNLHTYALYEIPAKQGSGIAEYFGSLKTKMEKQQVKAWEQKYQEGFDLTKSYLEITGNDPAKILANTLLNVQYVLFCGSTGRYNDLLAAAQDPDKKIFHTADLMEFFGRILYMSKDYKNSHYFFSRAYSLAPEWKYVYWQAERSKYMMSQKQP